MKPEDLSRTQLVTEVDRLRSEVLALSRALRTDSLTGLWNRRFVEERLAQEARADRRSSVILLDIDHFKQVNDTHGHDIGDAVLRQAAQLFLLGVRTSDEVCRWGGEEFIVLCPGAPESEAVQVAERLRERVASSVIPDLGRAVTVSAGVVELAQGAVPHSLRRADQALYAAKRQGRNRVYAASSALLAG